MGVGLGSLFGSAIVGTAELKTIPFSKIQGRLEPTWSTSASDPEYYLIFKLPLYTGDVTARVVLN